MTRAALHAALFVLGMLAGCIGYGEFISPIEAERIERGQCDRKQDAEERRICHGQVERKYRQYNAEGDYPDPRRSAPAPVR